MTTKENENEKHSVRDALDLMLRKMYPFGRGGEVHADDIEYLEVGLDNTISGWSSDAAQDGFKEKYGISVHAAMIRVEDETVEQILQAAQEAVEGKYSDDEIAAMDWADWAWSEEDKFHAEIGQRMFSDAYPFDFEFDESESE